MTEHMVKFDVIDLKGTLSLETFADQCVFLFADLHFEDVKYGAETSHGNKARVALIFVLEVRLEQKSSMSDISANAHQAIV